MRTPVLLIAALMLAGCGKGSPKSPEQPEIVSDPAEGGVTDGEGVEATPVIRPIHEEVNEAAALLSPDSSESDVQRALGILEGVLDRDPKNPEILFNLGLARQRLGDLTGAIRDYERVVAEHPEHGRAWLHIGLIRFGEGAVAEAEQAFTQGLSNDPEEMSLHVAKIDLLRTSGRLEEAVEAAKQALKVNANSVDVYNNMGLAYQDMGELVLAKFVFQKALNAIPGADENAYLHLNLGWTYFQQERVPAAVVELQRALELDPLLVPALVNLSRIYMADRNYEDTVPLLERAVEQAPGDVGVQMNLGIAYRGIERFEDAERQYRKVLEMEPSNPEPWMNLGILFGDYTKDYEASMDAFQSYIDTGGPRQAEAEEFHKLVKREKKRAEKRKKAEEDRKKREEDRAERQRLVEEAEAERVKAEEEAARAAEAAGEGAAPISPEGEQAGGGETSAPSESDADSTPDSEATSEEGVSGDDPWATGDAPPADGGDPPEVPIEPTPEASDEVEGSSEDDEPEESPWGEPQ